MVTFNRRSCFAKIAEESKQSLTQHLLTGRPSFFAIVYATTFMCEPCSNHPKARSGNFSRPSGTARL